ncbi:DNA primase [Mycoplasmopsis lipofaciens]|uniref:DNA primase n=1 Tax=Mycoplasmopsis lipofaciens TaxID=114884 RepID=UPI00048933CD|nr:DNA primase [Mycoplasmopsis lipofaciens]
MKKISQEQIDKIISNTDIVDIVGSFLTLTKKGQSYVSVCPFHQDTNPSMNIEPRKQIFKCFACNAGGNVVTFIQKYKKISFYEALKLLADKLNIELDIDNYIEYQSARYSEEDVKIFDILEKANSYFKLEFNKNKNNIIKNFYNERNLNPEIIQKFDIGFASGENFESVFEKELKNSPDLLVKASLINANNKNQIFNKRITFAIRNSENKIVAFSARTIINDEKPKYLNSSESNLFKKSNILYNYFNASQENDKEIIICEGQFDVIALYKIGIKNVVSLMGTALTPKHFSLLKNKKITLFLDGDDAGISATLKSAKFLISHGIDVKIVQNSTRQDPDEILTKYGEEYLKNLIKNATNALDFIYEYLSKYYNLIAFNNNKIDSIVNFCKEFVEYLQYKKLDIQNYYKSKIKSEFKFDIEVKQKVTEIGQYNSQEIYLPDENYVPFENEELFYNPNYPELVENYENLIFQETNKTAKLKIANPKKNDIEKIDWVDRLFYILLTYPDLIPLFIEKEKKKNLDLINYDDFIEKDEKYNKIINNNKDELIKLKHKLQNDQYDIIVRDFSLNMKTEEIKKQNFEELYKLCQREADKKFCESSKTMVNTLAKDKKIFKDFSEKIRKIKKRWDNE